jgi:hypothetical protein
LQYVVDLKGGSKMSRISLIILAAVGSLLCGCATAGWHTYAQQPRETQLASSGTRVGLICRDQAPTGSKIVKRECHTQAEWDTLAEDNMQQLNQTAARSMPQ